MEKMIEKIKQPLVSMSLGFILGLMVGLPILGWGLFPVKWIDASAVQLREDVRQDYLQMAIESYSKNPNTQLANQRWQELGVEAEGALNKIQNSGSSNLQEVDNFLMAVTGQGSVEPQVVLEPDGVISLTPETTDPKKLSMNLVLLLIVFGILTVVIGGTLLYIVVLRRKSIAVIKENMNKEGPVEVNHVNLDLNLEKSTNKGEGQELPIAQYITTYTLGDDLYDDSFSIDSPAGEFLGECGVGVSEHIGVGDPKKVTAFEVWLFDKNDIQTVTKVFMSQHAFNSPEINQKLGSKGEPVIIEPGKHVLLETATLQLEARVVDMNYGQGALPTNSYFERLILELAIWPKPPM